ncbi:MAG TPA: hypothetical protein VFA85_06150 [Terriglobales bacterium]|nr:hypothetical protein [Terriglobales bacterium]
MRHTLAAILLVFALFPFSVADESDSAPLGDVARATKRSSPEKTPVRTYDNDNLSPTETPNVSKTTPSDNSERTKAGTDVQSSQTSSTAATQEDEEDGVARIKEGQSPQERTKAYSAWKDRITKKKEEVDKLAREINDLETNPPQGVAVYHLWPDWAKYMIMLQEKHKVLDEARDQLSDLQEQARKTGVPSHFRD